MMMLTLAWLALMTVSALVQGKGPSIECFDKVAVLYEGTTLNTNLANITCSGNLASTHVTAVRPSQRCHNCFFIRHCLPGHCLEYTRRGVSLNYQIAPSYLITVACSDDSKAEVSEVIEVKITPNSPPFFDPDTLFVHIPIHANSPPSKLIYDVNASDSEGDHVIYSMKVIPASSDPKYTINRGTGEVYASVDLRTECDTHEVSLQVYISDGSNTVGPLVLHVQIENPSVTPVAANLNVNTNTIVQIPEELTGLVYTLMFHDNTASLTYNISSSDIEALRQFQIDGNKIKTTDGTTLDYENSRLRFTHLLVTAFNEFCSSPPYLITIQVTDVNEEPTISPRHSFIQVCEGKTQFHPGYHVTDPDQWDTVTWSLESAPKLNGSYYMSIKPTTGDLMTLIDYDVDGGASTTAEVVVKVTDKGGLFATATVQITFLDCNDNSPAFVLPYSVHAVTECIQPGSVIGSIKAMDNDSVREQNNVLYYRGSGGAVAVGTGGEIIVHNPLPAGQVITFNVYAWDMGQTPGPLRSVNPAVICVYFTRCPPTPTPSPSSSSLAPATTAPTVSTTTDVTYINEEVPSVAWIIIAALLGTFFLGLLSYMLWRYWSPCLHTCNRISCKKSSNLKRSRTQTSARPGFLFGFWKEHYLNNDLKSQPNRKAVPSPGDLEDHYLHTADLGLATVIEPQTSFCL